MGRPQDRARVAGGAGRTQKGNAPRALDQEGAIGVAEGSFVEPERGRDLGVADGRDHARWSPRRVTRDGTRASGPGRGGSGPQRVLGRLRELSERHGVAYRHVREDLAVDLDAGLGQAVDERGVSHPVLAGPRADPRDPQTAELPLAIAAVAVRVLPRVEQLLLGDAVSAGARAEVPLGLAKDLAALLLGVDRVLDPGHQLLLPKQPAGVC